MIDAKLPAQSLLVTGSAAPLKATVAPPLGSWFNQVQACLTGAMMRRYWAELAYRSSQGLSRGTPVAAKSPRLRVTTTRLCTKAVAASTARHGW